MTSRLSRAVKELAEALREVESNGSWEVVSEEGSEKSVGKGQIGAQSPAKSKEVQVETEASSFPSRLAAVRDPLQPQPS